ncbi:hypothetical protein EZV73_04270 [Acidaminobacter sp. JC074]|uniref:hypothetical protein n=1 Tax=Acidaminobacter sp. JC074 TaxID=2530199 RepID=UPI001F115C6C|nr:hypothetical protein [Acidaminobacter sp. JC074]MCH4886768.1 hypothetical protein [Acidaminobacter sp. JC074]
MNFSNEIIINKTFTHHDKDIKILSINDKSLWYAYQIDKKLHDKNLTVNSQRSHLMNDILFRSNIEILGLSIRNYIYCNGKANHYYPKSTNYEEIFNHFSSYLNKNYTNENTIILQLEFKEKIDCKEYYQYGLKEFLYSLELLIDSRKIYYLIEKEYLLDFKNEVALTLKHPIDNRTFTCYLKGLELYNWQTANQDNLQDYLEHKKKSKHKDITIFLPYETNESIQLEVCPIDPSYKFPSGMIYYGLHFEAEHLSTHGMKINATMVAELDQIEKENCLIELLAISCYSDKRFYRLETL